MPALSSQRPAVVSRAPTQPLDPDQYLMLVEDAGPVAWTQDPAAATTFASMKEATRAALRLPGSIRAFGLPLTAELAARGELH